MVKQLAAQWARISGNPFTSRQPWQKRPVIERLAL
jgi:hypothetical protein